MENAGDMRKTPNSRIRWSVAIRQYLVRETTLSRLVLDDFVLGRFASHGRKKLSIPTICVVDCLDSDVPFSVAVVFEMHRRGGGHRNDKRLLTLKLWPNLMGMGPVKIFPFELCPKLTWNDTIFDKSRAAGRSPNLPPPPENPVFAAAIA